MAQSLVSLEKRLSETCARMEEKEEENNLQSVQYNSSSIY